jgi:hypothetical protein
LDVAASVYDERWVPAPGLALLYGLLHPVREGRKVESIGPDPPVGLVVVASREAARLTWVSAAGDPGAVPASGGSSSGCDLCPGLDQPEVTFRRVVDFGAELAGPR